jgi:glycosyltransferase involved in cell wall biosynthesis
MTKGKSLRILFVTARYLPSVGGVEIHAHEVGTRLAKAGHRVTVLTVDAEGALPAREVVDGVEILRVPAWPKNKDYYLSPALYKAVRQADVDVVHCHGYYTFVAPLAMLAARRSHLPYIVTFHGRGHSSFLNRNLRIPQEVALRPLLSRAACLIALTKREQDFYRRSLRLPASAFTIIPGGADLVPVEELADVAVEPDLIVSVGRAERLKGHQKIIAALPAIAAVRQGVRLRICGDGPFAPELRRHAAHLGVADRVEIGAIPFARRTELAQTLRRAALVVSLSDSEAQPLAALEAAFLGRPLLVAAASGLTDLVKAGLAAGIAPDASSDVIANVILEQLEHLRPTASVRLPTWDDCAARLEGLYESVLRDGR